MSTWETNWFHLQWREERRERTETMRCPCGDVHGIEGDCPAYENTRQYLDDDKRYAQAQEDSR